jgi:hypothetical protein
MTDPIDRLKRSRDRWQNLSIALAAAAACCYAVAALAMLIAAVAR